MKRSMRVGYSFGMTSGVTTTLGLIVGLSAGTKSQIAVVGGIITIAIADGLSDSFGIHVSEESEDKHSRKEIWESTVSTFLSKFFLALSFLLPVYFFSLSVAVILSITWGLLLIIFISFKVAHITEVPPWKPILEHVGIAIAVIIITHLVGRGISTFFYS